MLPYLQGRQLGGLVVDPIDESLEQLDRFVSEGELAKEHAHCEDRLLLHFLQWGDG